MRNSTILFIFFGLIFGGAVLFAFVYLPKIDANSGLDTSKLSLELPVDVVDMRYDEGGVVPFCLEKNVGIDIQARENSSVFAPVGGAVTNIYPESKRIAIQATNGVYVYVNSVKNMRVEVGDYVSQGDVLGQIDGISVRFTVDNQLDKRYECPFLYLNDTSKGYLSEGLKQSTNSSKRICECSGFSY